MIETVSQINREMVVKHQQCTTEGEEAAGDQKVPPVRLWRMLYCFTSTLHEGTRPVHSATPSLVVS